MQKALGGRVNVVAEGLNGRTTAYDDHLADCDRNGARILPTILQSHAPIDLVIILLGTNDMKPVVHGTAFGAVQGIERLVKLVWHHVWPGVQAEAPEILIVAPPAICGTANANFAAMYAGGVEQSVMLASLYRRSCRRNRDAASSMPVRLLRPRRSTACISMPRIPAPSDAASSRWSV